MYIFYGVLALIGLVVFIVGLSMVKDKTIYDDQVSGINLAIVGAVVANAAGVSLLLAGRRAVTARRVAVLGAVPKVVTIEASITPTASSSILVGGEGLTHFHRADCNMAEGRDWAPLDRAAHESAGRTACGVCRP
jgi:hypothetical protein